MLFKIEAIDKEEQLAFLKKAILKRCILQQFGSMGLFQNFYPISGFVFTHMVAMETFQLSKV